MYILFGSTKKNYENGQGRQLTIVLDAVHNVFQKDGNRLHLLAEDVKNAVIAISHDAVVTGRHVLGIHVLERDLVEGDGVLIRPELCQ